MTHDTNDAPRRAATCPGPRIAGTCPGPRAGRAGSRAGIPAAAIAALLLAGCSTGHIGESWQCPLAEGGSCDSVAAADPAVPDPGASDGTVLAEPLWRVRDGGAPAASAETPPARGEPAPASGPGGQACAAECAGGFDPFAWFQRLFAAEADDGDGRPTGRSAPAAFATSAQAPGPAPGGEADAPAGPADPLPDPGPREPVPAPEPGGQAPEPGGQATGPTRDDAAEDNPAAGGLRTGEVVARIWIAPFVDANGVYREASHVRVVLEPAGWRLP